MALTDKAGMMALHHAARSDYNVEIAHMLLGHGADANARDAAGKTPLDHALAAKLERMPERPDRRGREAMRRHPRQAGRHVAPHGQRS